MNWIDKNIDRESRYRNFLSGKKCHGLKAFLENYIEVHSGVLTVKDKVVVSGIVVIWN